jgi:predicted nucleic acid-binding protein
MQLNSDVIISDTSCLILLSQIEELNLLKKISREVFITPIIRHEYGGALPHWITVKEPDNSYYQMILEMDLDRGEASAIALSMSIHNSLLIVDELKGRKIAKNLNLRYSGTLGLILKAKQSGIIPTIGPILEKIKKTNFWVADELFEFMMHKANE